MESAVVRLIVTHGPNLGHEYLLREDVVTIGRSASNSIVLPFPEVSRKHARLWTDGESIYLEDLGSTNGTFVNNTRLDDPVVLLDGDEVQIGDSFRLKYTSPEGVTRPISLVPEARVDEPGSAAASSDHPDPYPASEIPTPKPPLFATIEKQEFVSEQPANDSQQNRIILRCGCTTLILISICMLTMLFLDSYQQGRLLYCGSLNPIFHFLLGSIGFNPICP